MTATPIAVRSAGITCLLAVLVALGPLSTDLYLPALPDLTRELADSPAEGQLTLSVFLVGLAVGQLFYGPLSDRFGRRRLLIGGVALYAASGAACALATSIEMLIALRFVQALGACCGPVLGRAVVRDIHGPDGAVRILAYLAMAMALAPALGPILGGQLTEWLGWRASFWALAAFGAAALAGVFLLLPETNMRRDPEATRPRRLARNYVTLLMHRRYMGYLLIVAFSYSAIFSFISGSSFLMVDVLGLSPSLYGFSFATVVVGYMIGTFGAGRLTRRLGIDRMIVIGSTVACLGGIVMAACALAGYLSALAVVGPMMVVMIGLGFVLPNATAGAIAPFATMTGLASALMGFCQMGMAALVGIAVGRLAGSTALPMAGAIALVSLAASLTYFGMVRSRRPANGPAG